MTTQHNKSIPNAAPVVVLAVARHRTRAQASARGPSFFQFAKADLM